ncbi:hypothetical protein [Streptomyces spiramyceticus]|uniref:hypothetical protein n=1 Tax=Streptomyces spiramyceticus TaxID=299717 RepID=UPI00237B0AEC|nr:hypothetical protein [Streptomyces spiramyceticus]
MRGVKSRGGEERDKKERGGKKGRKMRERWRNEPCAWKRKRRRTKKVGRKNEKRKMDRG